LEVLLVLVPLALEALVLVVLHALVVPLALEDLALVALVLDLLASVVLVLGVPLAL